MIEHSTSGTFIVVDGPDGSGTTTVSKHLAEELNAVYTAEHGANRKGRNLIGDKVDEMIAEEGYSPETIALGFAADRGVHLDETVIPLLKDGKTVVCDRNYHSSLVYQPAMGLDFDWVKEINKHALKPDLTILMDVSADTAMERISGRDEDEDIFEDYSFQEEVAERYKRLPERINGNVEILNAELSEEEVKAEAVRKAKENLSL